MDRDESETGRPGARSQIGQNTLLSTDGERLCFDKGEKGFVAVNLRHSLLSTPAMTFFNAQSSDR